MNMQTTVRSPCVSICVLDEQDICTGCQRTGQEITRWGRISDAEKRDILELCEQRARDQGLWISSSTNAQGNQV